ncbi:MAG: bifunctional phosphoribosylaminoimidazolecarboxamide formyltransferase/IMP cyclohydrolase [Patescibacteria group bacterium]
MSKRALLSVYSKEGIVKFARDLIRLGYEIISSGGTAKALKEVGLSVIEISDLTGYPAMLGHRVATLHPAVHGGILARRIPEDEADLIKYKINRIDLVCVDLYPVKKCTDDSNRTILEMLDLTDIGGPTLIRGAAKNSPHGVTVICDPKDRPFVIDELEKHGHVREIVRAYLAIKVFATMAGYDGAIAKRFADEYGVPFFFLSSDEAVEVRYGTNPHQKEARVFFDNSGPLRKGQWEIPYEGKPLSYTNWEEILYTADLVSRFHQAKPTAVVFKHESPCGVASYPDARLAFQRAWNGDPIAAFGSTIGVNFAVTEALAETMARNFFEVLVCPSLDPAALAVFKKERRNLRILTTKAVLGPYVGRYRESKAKMGVILEQERDFYIPAPGDFIQVSERPVTERQLSDLVFAAICCQAIFSNATVICRDRTMIGYGRHGSSRVDTCEWAVAKVRQFERGFRSSVAVTDGFFPFPDGLEVLAKAGVKAIACPSAPTPGLKSGEVIKAADKLGVALLHLNHRLFRH